MVPFGGSNCDDKLDDYMVMFCWSMAIYVYKRLEQRSGFRWISHAFFSCFFTNKNGFHAEKFAFFQQHIFCVKNADPKKRSHSMFEDRKIVTLE